MEKNYISKDINDSSFLKELYVTLLAQELCQHKDDANRKYLMTDQVANILKNRVSSAI